MLLLFLGCCITSAFAILAESTSTIERHSFPLLAVGANCQFPCFHQQLLHRILSKLERFHPFGQQDLGSAAAVFIRWTMSMPSYNSYRTLFHRLRYSPPQMFKRPYIFRKTFLSKTPSAVSDVDIVHASALYSRAEIMSNL